MKIKKLVKFTIILFLHENTIFFFFYCMYNNTGFTLKKLLHKSNSCVVRKLNFDIRFKYKSKKIRY
jgi:hypothetical protein